MGDLRHPEFGVLPRRCQTLYVLEASNGLIKVGRSGKPRGRLTQHANELARTGAVVLRFEVVSPKGGIYALEKELVARVARRGTPRPGTSEWFQDVEFGFAANLLRQISGREIVVLT